MKAISAVLLIIGVVLAIFLLKGPEAECATHNITKNDVCFSSKGIWNAEYCERIQNERMRDECFVSSAYNTNNGAVCESVSNNSLIPGCFALSLQNTSCEVITDTFWKNKCLERQGIILMNISLCDDINTSGFISYTTWKNNCFLTNMEQTQNKSDATVVPVLNAEKIRLQKVLAIIERNQTECDSLTYPDDQRCMFDLAVYTNDSTLCPEDFKEPCFAVIARVQPALCDELEGYWHDGCTYTIANTTNECLDVPDPWLQEQCTIKIMAMIEAEKNKTQQIDT